MAMTIHCDIVSEEEEIFSGLVEVLVATGPQWMLDYRLDAYKKFLKKPMPEWVAKEKLAALDFDDIYYYVKPAEDKHITPCQPR